MAVVWGCAAALGVVAIGCAPAGPACGLIVVAEAPDDEAADFEDLAVVLAAAVDDRGRFDPTALVTQLPRLNRQLGRLARPWPAEAREAGSDVRLAWLYNARAAWSLRIVAQQRDLVGPGQDRYALPETISRRRLLDTPFTLDGRIGSLRRIDDELAAMADFRIAAAAPGATDLAGRLPRRPFEPATIGSAVAERFSEYVCDDRRVIIDHAARRVRVAPALHRARPDAIARYHERFGTTGAMFTTALGPYLNDRARRRMSSATGYRSEVRRGPAGIVMIEPKPLARGPRD